jgi:hypothetical protein
MNDNDFLAKTSKPFYCNICDYRTDRKNNLKIHFESLRHKNNATNNENNGFLAKTSKHYECKNCSKIFNDRAGLWRHNKKCDNQQIVSEDNPYRDCFDKQLFLELLKQNTEFKHLLAEQHKYIVEQNKQSSEFKELIVEQNKQIIELAKEKTITNSHNNTTNNTTNNNNNFNLKLFLNETCKNAMNINEFVELLGVKPPPAKLIPPCVSIEDTNNSL